MGFSKAKLYCVLRGSGSGNGSVVLSRRRLLTCALSVGLCLSSLYILWPSNPDLKIVGLKLRRIKVHPVPHLSLDISMVLRLRVHNADVYSMDFGAVNVAVAYRGNMMGQVTSNQVHVGAMASSYVDADVDISGIPDVVLLLEDLARGIIPLLTVTHTTAQFRFLFFNFPIKAKLSCEVLVSIINHTIVPQHCLHQ